MEAIVVFGGVFIFPIIVYFSVKMGTYGYLSARRLFDQQHQKKDH